MKHVMRFIERTVRVRERTKEGGYPGQRLEVQREGTHPPALDNVGRSLFTLVVDPFGALEFVYNGARIGSGEVFNSDGEGFECTEHAVKSAVLVLLVGLVDPLHEQAQHPGLAVGGGHDGADVLAGSGVVAVGLHDACECDPPDEAVLLRHHLAQARGALRGCQRLRCAQTLL